MAVLLACSALGACAAPPLRCPAGTSPMRAETLYFGTRMPDGVVSEGDWRGFLDAAVVPRLSAGFTVWPAAGVWRTASGDVQREDSRVLTVIRADAIARGSDAAPADPLEAIVADYRRAFNQESVLRVSTRVCAGF